MTDLRSDLTRTIFNTLLIVALIGTSLWIVRPFLTSVIWAATVVIATWPIMLRVQSWLWNRRGLATAVMTLALLVVFVVPFSLAIGIIVDHSGQIVDAVASVGSMEMPRPPAWLSHVPLAGPGLAHAWEDLSQADIPGILQKVRPYVGMAMERFVGAVGELGMIVVQFLLTVAVSAILFAQGEAAAALILRFGRRLAGGQGERAVRLAAQAIRGVALGVVVTALIQTAIGTAGLVIAGVPAAALLSAVMFVCCIAQLGPALILVPAVVWMYHSGATTWATVLLAFSVVAITIDNFIRPILIRRGADLPLLLILAGVIGGLMAFGLIGIFVGPMVLAVSYTLLDAWMLHETPDAST